MSIPIQKFFVGQDVMVRSIQNPEFNTDRTTVTYAEYVDRGEVIISHDASNRGVTGRCSESDWYYGLTHICPDILTCEECLRPRPYPATKNYDQIIRSLKSTRTNEELETI